MTWDVVFLLRGYPPEYRFFDRHYFMAKVAEEMVALLRTLVERLPETSHFFRTSGPAEFTVIGFRVEADDEKSAMELAKHHLAGFIDGLAILVDRQLPEVSPLVHVRKTGDADVRLFLTGEPTWAYLHPKDPASAANWRERGEKVFRALFPFFDIASGLHPRRDTSLSRQLLYSMKMYRHGAATGIYGLEFICKWSALEGLVCGGERDGKRALLLDRVPALFPAERPAIETTVKELWILRNEAVHEARAFYSEHLDDGQLLALEIDKVEHLFLAVVVFALDHLDRADSVKTLWPFAAGYQMPAFVTQKRPSDMPRFAVTNFLLNPHLIGTGVGALIDAAFASQTPPVAAAVAEPPPTP